MPAKDEGRSVDSGTVFWPIMYICEEGHVFDEPHTYYGETLEYFGAPCRQKFTECPVCGGNYERAKKCSRCDEYTSESQARFNLCADCEIDAEKRFNDFISREFTKDEREYLDNQYEGMELGFKYD